MRDTFENIRLLTRLSEVKDCIECALNGIHDVKTTIQRDEDAYGAMPDEFDGWNIAKNLTDKSTIDDLRLAYERISRNIVRVCNEISEQETRKNIGGAQC